MEGRMTQLIKDGRPVSVFMPGAAETAPLFVVYMLAGPDPALELTGVLERANHVCPPAVVAVGTSCWNSDYSPWPAEPVIKGEPPFTGGAGAYLAWLTGSLIPHIENAYRPLGRPGSRVILGYSLAGLTALYAMYVTDAFSACGCCSGSLWYDGWTDYMAAHRVRPGARIYLSLGKNEEKTKNPRMSAVGNATRSAYELLAHDDWTAGTMLEMNDGGHFSQIPERMAKALTWIVR